MIGERVGHFRIIQKLGEGGMGAVYVGEHEVMRKKVAIKVLLPQWTQNAMIVQRFTNEAIAMGSLEHPNIVSVTDCGQLADGSWYIVMEYLDGVTLGKFSSTHGALSPHQAIHVLAQAAAGLEAAHKRGIVHRDLKPENIFLVNKKNNPQFVKILDWGISKLGEQEAGSVTRTGMMAGTPMYMAPEQMRDLRTVDRRTDVYALGIIAYQLLTGGWLPFQKKEKPEEFASLSLVGVHEVITREPPIDPRHHVPHLDARIVNALLAALHPDPARRPQTSKAFVLLLAAAVGTDGYNKSGTDIIKDVAPELLEIGNLEETVRAVKVADAKKPPSRYRLGDQLGAGGMAEVFRATQVGAEGFSRVVAVKRVLPGFSSVPQFASMFVQEAKLASHLDHPNIVSVLDFDRDEEGRLFLAMEYIEGRDLAAVAASGRLPFFAIIFIISEALRGLGYAHNIPTANGPLGLVHRDVSPQNVLISWEGAVKVSDFGIAKARDASQATASTMIKGKPQYMSPEQANGEALDGRSDLFAIGIMMWELLTGRRLFEGSTHETLARIVLGNVSPPSSVSPDVPHDLESVTMRLLARDRNQRYANANAVIEDLYRCSYAPRDGRSELARLLAERFPDAIAARMCRPQLAGASVHGSQSRVTAQEQPGTRRDPAPQPTPVGQWPSNTTLGSAASQAIAPARSSKSRAPMIVAAMLGIGSAVAGGVYVATRKTDATKSASEGQRGSGEASPTPQPPVAPKTLTINTEPSGALVRVDGVDRGPSPVTLNVESGQRIAIEADATGYDRSTQTVTVGTQSQTVDLALRATAAPIDAGQPVVAAPPPDARPKNSTRKSSTSPTGKTNARPKQSPTGTFNPDDVVE